MASFKDFNLSEATLNGLEETGFKEPTPIQSKAIPSAIAGEDILGAAQTGSGKTLAFLVPILERLTELKWASVYGLGVLIITPTRELAYQIYEVLRKIGKHHTFSAGLIIGGKDLKYEWSRLSQTNIVICTPGRLLQHMDQNPSFDCSSLEILVLDEADRILDMGFADQLNAIIENLPPKRQTLLFSATQTRSVKDLARLSLTNPKFVSADEAAPFVTPDNLKQSYVVLNPEEKLNFLWSFLTFHRQHKTLVFLACCKEVKFFYEVLCHLRPGCSVLALYGTQHQLRRMDVYDKFYRKEHAVLLATDIASRGLDFPAVDFVLQLDCPDDVTQYIHRAGRTARYNRNGSATLALTPSEETRFVPLLEEQKIPIGKLEVNSKHLNHVQSQLENILAKFPELRESAQRCFKAYLKSVWMVRKKDALAMNLDAYGASLGLHSIPRIRFIERHRRETDGKGKVKASGPGVVGDIKLIKHFSTAFQLDDEASDDDVLKPKKQHQTSTPVMEHKVVDQEEQLVARVPRNKTVSKASVAKRLMKKGFLPNVRIKFDDEGNVAEFDGPVGKTIGEISEGLNLNDAKQLIAKANEEDKILFRQRIKEKHKLERKIRKSLKRKPGQPAAKEEAEELGVIFGDEDEFRVTLGCDEEAVLDGVSTHVEKKRKRKSIPDSNDVMLKSSDIESAEREIKVKKLNNRKKYEHFSETACLKSTGQTSQQSSKKTAIDVSNVDALTIKRNKKRASKKDQKAVTNCKIQFDEDLALRLLSG